MPVYPPLYHGPARNYTRDGKGEPTITGKKYIVIHHEPDDTAAASAAAWSTHRQDSTSSHYYCDAHQLIQMLDTDWRAQHTGSKQGNDHGISYQITGGNWWTFEPRKATCWITLCEQIAADCRHHQIEAQPLTVTQIQAGTITGIVTGEQCRQAWEDPGHTSPGPHFPIDHLTSLVHTTLTTAPKPIPSALPALPRPAIPPSLAPAVPQPGNSLPFWIAHLWRVLTRRWAP